MATSFLTLHRWRPRLSPTPSFVRVKRWQRARLISNGPRPKYLLGRCQARLNKPADALATFTEIATELNSASDTDRQAWQAKALISKAVTLGRQLGRSEDAIAVYDKLVARFGAASELALRKQVAEALFNKGVRLAELHRNEEEIAVYDELTARFGAASEWACANKSLGRFSTKGSGSANSTCSTGSTAASRGRSSTLHGRFLQQRGHARPGRGGNCRL